MGTSIIKELCLLQLVDESRMPVSVGLALADQTPERQPQLAEYLQGHPDRKLNLKAAKQLGKMDDWSCDNLSQLFEKKKKSKPSSRFDQVMPILCDQYCKFAAMGARDKPDAYCGQCILAKMLERML